jgi:hypothetical protein
VSGPPYPRFAPGSSPGGNAIGSFIIGQSPIGTIPSFDIWQTVISQYANAPILTQLITNFFQYIDQTANLDAFYDFIWNVDSAQGYGLDVWGRIVGVVRQVTVTGTLNYFGFNEAGAGAFTGFNQQPFYSGAQTTNVFNLSDSAFRVLIFAKALANISDGSIKSINQLLLNLFPGRGNCYVVDGENMTMQYMFKFALSPVELVIVQQSGVLPKPTGVSATVVVSA